jgi:hypothetical protein
LAWAQAVAYNSCTIKKECDYIITEDYKYLRVSSIDTTVYGLEMMIG